MTNLKTLEELRTRKEVEDYFKQLGKEITEKELNELKQSYNKAQEDNSALTMQQLDDVAGGKLFIVKNGFVHIFDDINPAVISQRILNQKGEDFTAVLYNGKELRAFSTFDIYAGDVDDPKYNVIMNAEVYPRYVYDRFERAPFEHLIFIAFDSYEDSRSIFGHALIYNKYNMVHEEAERLANAIALGMPNAYSIILECYANEHRCRRKLEWSYPKNDFQYTYYEYENIHDYPEPELRSCDRSFSLLNLV